MSFRSLLIVTSLLSLPVFSYSGGVEKPEKKDPWKKVTFDISGLTKDGLRGPPDGRRAVSYEFCIPNTDVAKAKVKAIDPTVKFMAGSRGRIGCTRDQCLCIGSTHQKDFKSVLRALAELPFIERIDECFFE